MRNSNKKLLIIIGLIVTVSSLSVGYAALKTSLSISGTATVDPSSLNFAILSVESGTTGPNDEVESLGTINENDSTELNGISVKLAYPSSYANVKITVVNNGNLTAKLEGCTISINNTIPEEASPETISNETLVANDIVITLYAKDQTTIYGQYKNGVFTEKSYQANVVESSGTDVLYLKIEYPYEAEYNPTSSTEIDGISVGLTYKQVQAQENS